MDESAVVRLKHVRAEALGRLIFTTPRQQVRAKAEMIKDAESFRKNGEQLRYDLGPCEDVEKQVIG